MFTYNLKQQTVNYRGQLLHTVSCSKGWHDDSLQSSYVHLKGTTPNYYLCMRIKQFCPIWPAHVEISQDNG